MLKKLLIFVPIMLLLIGSIFYHFKIDSLQNDVQRWQNQAASLDSVSTYYKTINEKLSLQVSEIQSENKKLNKLLAKKDEIIQSQVIVIGVLKDSLQNVGTKDTTIIIVTKDSTSSVSARAFSVKKPPFSLSGHFFTISPYTISFDNISADIDLEINIVESKDKTYKVYVDTKYNNFIITNLTSKVVPYSPTFWEKLNLGLGIIGSKDFISAYGKIYYSHYSLLTGFSNKGWVFGTEYAFRK